MVILLVRLCGLITLVVLSTVVSAHIHLLMVLPATVLICLALCADSAGGDIVKLNEEAERCRVIAETARVYIIHFTLDNIVTYANEFSEEISGYSRDEIIGKNFVDVLVPPEYRERVIQDIKPVIAGTPTINYESPMITKSGEVRAMLWSGARTLGADGKPNGLVASGVDITELKQTRDALAGSERLYRNLVEHSVAGIFIVQGRHVVFANKRAEEISGYTIEEAQKMDYLEFAVPEDRETAEDRVTRRLRGEDVPERYENRLLTKSGEIRTCEIWSTLIDYQNKPAILSTLVDITERKTAEDNRLRAEIELGRHKREFYRNTITAVTQGKLDVMEPDEIGAYYRDPHITMQIDTSQDISLSRKLVGEFAENLGLASGPLDEFVLAVGEASVNALKHAGSGTMMAGARDSALWVAVSDSGPGIDAIVISQAIFRRGFSTKPSLGFGYTLILECSDHVYLSTSPDGTTVIIEKALTPVAAAVRPDLARFPDTW